MLVNWLLREKGGFMNHILRLAMMPGATSDEHVDTKDLYDLPHLDLSPYRALIVTGGCDQVFLEKHRDTLTAFAEKGGVILLNGHPVTRYVKDLPQMRKMQFKGVNDVFLWPLDHHPIWNGIDRKDVLFNTGVPGVHTFEELTKIGVAGFYAHAYLVDIPQGATLITGIGEHRMPVDLSYRLGKGEVIVHCGNDLTSFDRPGTSAARFSDAIIEYLEACHA